MIRAVKEISSDAPLYKRRAQLDKYLEHGDYAEGEEEFTPLPMCADGIFQVDEWVEKKHALVPGEHLLTSDVDACLKDMTEFLAEYERMRQKYAALQQKLDKALESAIQARDESHPEWKAARAAASEKARRDAIMVFQCFICEKDVSEEFCDFCMAPVHTACIAEHECPCLHS